LVCLTGGQLNLVRNLLLYAERRSTFVSEYESNTYLSPTTEEWDALQTMLADLEGNLMDCEQFTQDLQEILDWVRLQASVLGALYTEEEQALFPYNDEIADDELTPAEEEACAIAQLWFEWGYQVITEYVLPATRFGFDYLLPLVAGVITGWVGGPPGVLGAWAVAEFIQEILEIFYRGSETNLVNWMDTNKEDIVCVLFGWLKVGGDASAIWQYAYDAVIAPAEDIAVGDKLMLNLFMGSWAGSNAQKAFDAETEWATSNVSSGYCDDCLEVPIVGSDWWALPLVEEENTIIMDHGAGAYWLKGCWEIDVPTGYTLCGVVYRIQDSTGDCTLKRMGRGEGGCSGGAQQLWGNESGNNPDDTYFAVNGTYIDEVECKAALAPGSTSKSSARVTGENVACCGWNMGWNCTGYAEIVFEYAVFEGTEPF